MRLVRWLVAVTALIGLYQLSLWENHMFRRAAQKNEFLYQVMLAGDLADFMSAAGGPIRYDNYFKWHYFSSLRRPPHDLPKQYEFPALF